MKPVVLVVDDEKTQRLLLCEALEEEGYCTLESASGEQALRLVEREHIDIVLLDYKMPGWDGVYTLGKIREVNPILPVIIITAYATVDTAIKALKFGAFDFLTKPVDLDVLLHKVEMAVERGMLLRENRELRKLVKERSSFPGVVGESPAIQEVLAFAKRAAEVKSTVLIRGESGTGKELIAKLIHDLSSRKSGPFIAVSCAALPESLVESELFGYEKGAFTGAERRKPGRFELANGGTIFLDEIGDLPLTTQVKLLRVLQEKTFERLGGTEPVKVDVRVIAATNADLEEKIKRGEFREDLYYRLNVLGIYIPPLRERREDIPLLANYFLGRVAKDNGKGIRGFTEEAMQKLVKYSWPGNVRELENVVERACVMARGEMITLRDLPPEVKDWCGEGNVAEWLPLEEIEKQYIKRVLEYTKGNQVRASEILGIHRNTLRRKIKGWGLEV